MTRPVYPLGLRLEDRPVLVVGGGEVALRRVTGLLEAGADVTVVAPAVVPFVEHLAQQGAVRWLRRRYAAGDVAGSWLVHACTDDPEVNAAVAADAGRARLFCVRADDADASSAWTPATGRAGRLTVAIHADGDPRRAVAARERALAALAADPPPAARPRRHDLGGTVALVGAGPGDPGLMTVRSRELLEVADVVVTDRLVPVEALAGLRGDVHVVDATKLPGGRSMPQEEICATLVAHARAGRFVVRLKGGDPFVFGRGLEEVEACVAAGVAVEVVPGVTSAVSVPALAGIPVTSRGASQAFVVVSGHVPPGHPKSTVDWAALARSGATLVLLMAMGSLAEIVDALVAGGRDAATGVGVVQEGGTVRQRSLFTSLRDVVPDVAAAGLGAPAVVVVGEVVDAARAVAALRPPQ